MHAKTGYNRAMAFDHQSFLASLTGRPGIYQMFDGDGAILYVGKAKNLKSRLASYFRKTGLSPKTQALVKQIQHTETTITHTERIPTRWGSASRAVANTISNIPLVTN